MSDPEPNYRTGERPLAAFAGAIPPAEPWMLKALDQPGARSSVTVEGAEIDLYTWGERGKPGLLFIHGGVAHARWWDFTIPFFSRDYSCTAFSLSGMGNSGRRETYAHDLYAAEALAAAEATGLFEDGRKPMLVGHSFGGLVTVQTLQRHGERFAGGVVVDSPLIPLERRLLQERRRDREHPPQPSVAEAVARFRLLPDEPSVHPFILDHVARHGLTERDDGVVWSFDPNLWGKMDPKRGHPDFAAVAGRIAFVRGAQSTVVGEESATGLRTTLGPDSPFVEIPEAWHHVMLNRPLAFVSALRAILQSWPPARSLSP